MSEQFTANPALTNKLSAHDILALSSRSRKDIHFDVVVGTIVQSGQSWDFSPGQVKVALKEPSELIAEMLHHLIEMHSVAQNDVTAGTGLAESTISKILTGKRKLSVRHIDALARLFEVKAAVFLDD